MDSFGQSDRTSRALLLATGQTTVYATGDNGTNQVGELHDYTVLTTGQYSGTTNITLNAKTNAHSNECVFDAATSLMWSRNVSGSVGPTSNGLLPWTVNAGGEGIFEYAAAANSASLAGYTDWRVPNIIELYTLMEATAPTGYPDAVAFPTVANSVLSSTTIPSNTSLAMLVSFSGLTVTASAKTNTAFVRLVRGPV